MDQSKEQASKQLQIPEQQEYLNCEIIALHERISILASRLEPVLRGSDPQVADKISEGPDLTILANTLKMFCRDIKVARSNIKDLIDRLEL